jgi:DNA helicase-2/ATP-dependent DNA helicase PcrA
LVSNGDLVESVPERNTPVEKEDRFVLGDKVIHGKWGVGVVVGIAGSGNDAEIKVAFPEQGIKVLLTRYAPLEKVN